MKQQPTNSRRNFLSTIAILGSGTVLAGSPLNVWNSKRSVTSVEEAWNLLLNNYSAVASAKHPDIFAQHAVPALAGQYNQPGKLVAFGRQQLLALPTWIYWSRSSSRPDDVVITFFENVYPYKKVKSMNRFELLALARLPHDNNTLHSVCNNTATNGRHQLSVTTKIGRGKTVQEVKLLAGKDIVSKQQFFYNV